MKRIDAPAFPEWEALVVKAQAMLHEKKWPKIVLARRTILHFDEAPSPYALLRALSAHRQEATLYFYAPEKGVALLGATPELLFHRERRSLLCEAVAGSFALNTDAMLGLEKRQAEFSPVKAFFQKKLTPLCKNLDRTPDTLRSTAHLHHHLATFKGRLKEGVTDQQLLHDLHPTPAVCGEPHEEIQAFLRTHEPFARGWYAGPMGWISDESTQMHVVLRCALVRGKEVHLFAGAGIVPDSNPAAEWQELELKITTFLKILNAEAFHVPR